MNEPSFKLTFLGTRANITARNRRHGRHASLLIHYRNQRLMIDCGEDWLERLKNLQPDAIVLTHAHPDHAWGLQNGTDRPVYATPETWQRIDAFAIENRHTLNHRESATIGDISIEAFPVDHSTRCPACGFRIAIADTKFFYVPDVVYIHDRGQAMTGCSLYIGDGASFKRSLVRRRDGNLLGHAAIKTQLTWCEKTGVPEALFTHCGTEIVEGDERRLRAELNEWAAQRDMRARLAYDGMEWSPTSNKRKPPEHAVTVCDE